MATYTGADKALAFLFKMASNLADDYDDSATYALNAYAIYEGILYKCINPVSSPETFTPAHWQAVLVMDEVAAGGGGGGGTTVIANPAGQATDTLNKLQVGSTIYSVPSGGGSSGHNYSTTEQVVGTWIDGSTVYEKTVNLNGLPNNATKTVAHGIINLSYIIQAYGFGYGPNGIPIPFVDNNSNATQQLALIINDTNIIVRTNSDRSAYTTAYVTMLYTKSA